MNKKSISILILVVLIVGGVYLLSDSFISNNRLLGVSHFNNSDISFDYPSIWIEDKNTNFNLTFRSLFYTMNLDIYDISNTSFEKSIDGFLQDNSNFEVKYKVLKINETMVDGQKAYDISSNITKNGKQLYQRDLIFESNNKMYIIGFLTNDFNIINNDFNFVKNSIHFK
ncbi:PsbP-related protein [Methanobrevibacter sp.]|uniref:PsbP-related protein n=1 Tax=Methanobrevibacter sp. TaxID=66852 RepID=UPI002602D127|nr:hypothetical protein [uncultured Methanobrevibacter sp.]